MTTRIRPGQVAEGMFITHDGRRWQVIAATPVPGGARLRLNRAWMLPPERASVTWTEPVTLTDDQGVCLVCGAPLTHGLNLGAEGGDETSAYRTQAGGRYFCPDSGDGLHHPRLIRPLPRQLARRESRRDLADALGEALADAIQSGLAPQAIRAALNDAAAAFERTIGGVRP
jgi:hypothetical protein